MCSSSCDLAADPKHTSRITEWSTGRAGTKSRPSHASWLRRLQKLRSHRSLRSTGPRRLRRHSRRTRPSRLWFCRRGSTGRKRTWWLCSRRSKNHKKNSYSSKQVCYLFPYLINLFCSFFSLIRIRKMISGQNKNCCSWVTELFMNLLDTKTDRILRSHIESEEWEQTIY